MKRFFVNTKVWKNKFNRLYTTESEDIFAKYPKAKPHGETLKQAINYFSQKKYSEAVKLFDESSTKLSQELPKHHPLLGIAYNNFGECLRLESPKDFERIEELYQISLDIWTHKDNEITYASQLATLYNNIGMFNIENKKDYEKALEFFENSERLRYQLMKNEKDLNMLVELKGQIGITINNKGLCYHHLNKFEQAVPCFKESISLLKEQFSTSSVYISVLNNIGMSLTSMERYDDASKYLEEAISIISKNPSQTNAFDTGLTYANLAKLKYQLKDVKGAEDLYRKSLSLLKSTLPEDHKQIGLVTANLAVCVMENKGSKTEIYQLTKSAQQIALKHSSSEIMNNLLKLKK